MEKIKKVFITLLIITFICQNAGFCVFERDSALRLPMTSVTRMDNVLKKITPRAKEPSKQLAKALKFFTEDPVLSSLRPEVNVTERNQAEVIIRNPLNLDEFESIIISFQHGHYLYTRGGGEAIFKPEELDSEIKDCLLRRLREDLEIRIWIEEIRTARQKVLRLISSNPNRFESSDKIMTEASTKGENFRVPDNVVDNAIDWLLENGFIARDTNGRLYTDKACILTSGNIVKFDTNKGFIIYSQEGYKIKEVELEKKYGGFDSAGNYILTWEGNSVVIWDGETETG